MIYLVGNGRLTIDGGRMDETKTTVLHVLLGEIHPQTDEELRDRFRDAYDFEGRRVAYQCTHESHAEDVFRDEFADPYAREYSVQVEYACITEYPIPVDEWRPFTSATYPHSGE